MPELPEVETIRRQLSACLPGRTIEMVEIMVPKLARPDPESFRSLLPGQSVRAVTRVGKRLVFRLSRHYLLCHLKLSGRLIFENGQCPPASNTPWHIAFRFTDGSTLYHHDLRRFGGFDLSEKDPAPGIKLGPEPLSSEFTPEKFRAILTGRRTRIKPLLLDQEKISGLGNIYAAEALFRAGIHPDRPAGSLDRGEADRLFRAVNEVIALAIEEGGTSVSDYFRPDGSEGRFQEMLFVYRRHKKDCRVCRTPIAVNRDGNRSTYYCPGCQEKKPGKRAGKKTA